MGMVDFIYNAMNSHQNQQNMNGMADPMMSGMSDSYGMPMETGINLGMQDPMMLQQQMPQMYPQMNMMGMQDYGCKPVHYSKYEILEGLKNYIYNTTGIMVCRVVKLDDYPQFVKHACMQGKVQRLVPNTFTVPEAGISLQYWFCMYCGKLFILKDAI